MKFDTIAVQGGMNPGALYGWTGPGSATTIRSGISVSRTTRTMTTREGAKTICRSSATPTRMRDGRRTAITGARPTDGTTT